MAAFLSVYRRTYRFFKKAALFSAVVCILLLAEFAWPTTAIEDVLLNKRELNSRGTRSSYRKYYRLEGNYYEFSVPLSTFNGLNIGDTFKYQVSPLTNRIKFIQYYNRELQKNTFSLTSGGRVLLAVFLILFFSTFMVLLSRKVLRIYFFGMVILFFLPGILWLIFL